MNIELKNALKAGALGLTSGCVIGMAIVGVWDTVQGEKPTPVVVTSDHNVVVDMPAGVRWDIRYIDGEDKAYMISQCDKDGGELIWDPRGPQVTWTCEGVDF